MTLVPHAAVPSRSKPGEPTSVTRWATPKSIRGETAKVVTTTPARLTFPEVPSMVSRRPGAVTLIQPSSRDIVAVPTTDGSGSSRAIE